MWKLKKDRMLGNYVKFSRKTLRVNPEMIKREYAEEMGTAKKQLQDAFNNIWKVKITKIGLKRLLESHKTLLPESFASHDLIDLPTENLEIDCEEEFGEHSYIYGDGLYKSITYERMLRKLNKAKKYADRLKAIEKEFKFYFPNSPIVYNG